MKNLKELPVEYQEDIKKAVKILKENGATEIFIFGSIVNGNFNKNSDIDIAIRGIKQENPYVRVYLGTSKGKEDFYRKFGFITRSEAGLGKEMILRGDNL